MLNSPEYLKYLCERQASTSIGASTARGMGPKGTIQAARKYLKSLDLKRLKKRSQTAFIEELEIATGELMNCLPKDHRHWGSARKFINIFLRGCCYNKYLSAHHKLETIEPWLEVPLDSHVAKGLKLHIGRGELPRWKGVIHLRKDESDKFQLFAADLAKRDGVNRVDLDVKFWRRVG
ncbi:MAG: hypothetical protein Q7U33_07535 [Methylotenera sp.]|uniref:hypothetical protein n=1 Tax=Methylotenera sp. TaxID=2051956 RepID=UPI002719FED2|nr:hypothetical protein [Methylotenera sp.]MDO9151211.1 hypothetical protein [Methylotenera sp.]